MAKYNFKADPEVEPTPGTFNPEQTPAIAQETSADAVATQPPPPIAPAPGTYIGPKYKFGIIIPDTTVQVTPKTMNAEQRADLIARYPPASAWWA